jgi:hypothetical protein
MGAWGTGASHRIAVSFTGQGSGVEELSWGQWELWEGIRRLRTWMPIAMVKPLPAGTTVDDVVSELRFLMSRYQTMRTRLRLDPDGPRQVVAEQGVTELEVVDVDVDGDPAKAAEEVERRYREYEHDFTTDWPVRVAVIRHRGVPTHQVLVGSRLVGDAAAAAVIAADLAARDPRTGEAPTPVAAMQPMELARWQRSPAGQRQSEAALRHWEALLRRIPARRFGDSTDPRRPRYWRAGFSSAALHLAARAIVARTGSRPASVLLAVFAVALARVTGVNPVAVRVIANNRFRPGLAEAVGPVAQTGLLAVDVADTTFDEALARTRRGVLAAYKYAYYDASRLYELVARIGHERGEQIHIGCFFDDRRLVGERSPAVPAPVATAPTERQVREALAHTSLRWLGRQDEPLEELFVHVDGAPDGVEITVQADTHYLAPGDIEAFLRGMEAVAVEAAFDPAVPTRVTRG